MKLQDIEKEILFSGTRRDDFFKTEARLKTKLRTMSKRQNHEAKDE